MMNLIQFETATDFLAKSEAYLLAEECLNGLMLGICYRLQAGFYDESEALLAAVVEDGQLVATAVRTPPHAPIIYTSHPDPAVTMSFLAQALSQQALPGVSGPVAMAGAFARAWQNETGRPAKIEMKQRIYKLHQVEYMPDVAGELRQAGQGDFELLTTWMMGFNEDAFGESDRSAAEEQASRHLAEGNLFLWEDGRPVSVAAKTRETPHGRTVSLVYTPPDLRGRGYATACVASLSQMLLAEGYQFCTLFTDLSNPTSNSIYQKIGYRPVTDFDAYRFE